MIDIEWELCCFSREVSVRSDPFAILGAAETMWTDADSRIEIERLLEPEEVRHLDRFTRIQRHSGARPSHLISRASGT